jgi:hypothetical protein
LDNFWFLAFDSRVSEQFLLSHHAFVSVSACAQGARPAVSGWRAVVTVENQATVMRPRDFEAARKIINRHPIMLGVGMPVEDVV